MSDVHGFLERYAAEWQASTAGTAFIAGVRDGSLDRAAFERWLVQDRHFVDRLYAAQLRIAALAAGEARRALLGGAVALQEELDWFVAQAEQRGIDLDVPPVEDCLAFADYLDTLAFAPVAVALTAIWTVERAYLDAWTAARPGAEAYREFVEHWSHPGFEDYVEQLRVAADEALAGASARDRAGAEEAFRRVMAFERRFWRMTETGSGREGGSASC